jgi:hypothetical protein
MTSLNSCLNIRESGTLITSFRTILPAWGAVFSTTPAITEEASLERLDSPSGVFDQSFAFDDNGTDIHCAKVQRESARYIADCLGRDFEKPVDPIERRIQMFATRRLLSRNKAKLWAGATSPSCAYNASRPRINASYIAAAAHVFWPSICTFINDADLIIQYSDCLDMLRYMRDNVAQNKFVRRVSNFVNPDARFATIFFG